MLLPMFLVLPATPRHGALRLVIFDVGQGLSVAAQTHNHVLLYDAGPDYPGDADSGNRILVPSLRAQGIAQLDGLMLTHDDTDHTGGALSVMQAMPVNWLSSSLPDDSPIVRQARDQPALRRRPDSGIGTACSSKCCTPRAPATPMKTSARTIAAAPCASAPARTAYCSPPTSRRNRERRLLQQHPEKLPATLLVVPHHGSKTSSTQAFVTAVHPHYAVFTVGYRNRFGHPGKTWWNATAPSAASCCARTRTAR